MSRVKNPLPEPTACRYCGASVKLADNSEIYGRSYGRWPKIWLCTGRGCRAYVGTHPGTRIPLGTLADSATREARKRCKPDFEKLWRGQSAFLSRSGAYKALANELGIPAAECHFGWFDIEQCYAARIAARKIMREHRAANASDCEECYQ